LLKTYSIYTQCVHCGVYDRDPAWCDLCGKPKEASSRPGDREPTLRGDRTLAIQPKLKALSHQ
jgi:hypothetical protein